MRVCVIEEGVVAAVGDEDMEAVKICEDEEAVVDDESAS